METSRRLSWPLFPSETRANFLRLMRQCNNSGVFGRTLDLWEAASPELWELGYWNDYLQCGTVALSAAEGIGELPIQGQLLNELGWVHMERREYELAKNRFDNSLDIYQRINDLGAESRVLRDLGTLHLRLDRRGSAIHYYRLSLAIVARESNKAQGNDKQIWIHRRAELQNLLGSLYYKMHDYVSSGEVLRNSVLLYRSLGDSHRYFQTAPLMNIGRWFFRQKDYTNAYRFYELSRVLSDELGRVDMLSGVFIRQAEIAEINGDNNKAIELLQQAEQIAGTALIDTRERASEIKFRITNQAKEGFVRMVVECLSRWQDRFDLVIHAPDAALRGLYLLIKQRLHARDTDLQKIRNSLLDLYETMATECSF